MSVLDSYYRSYKKLLSELEENKVNRSLKRAFNDADKNTDVFNGSITFRDVDLEWVEAIEKCLPYIDKSIREQRRFIQQEEEIVPIEKSKRVGTEAVRHLAQHTSMIGRVENDTVTPKEILNINREESFDIYENRYLRTLINRTIDFVERRYEQIRNVKDISLANINMQRSVLVENQKFDINLGCVLEYQDDKNNVDIADDVSTLSGFQRVLRLRIILSDFLQTPLLKAIANTPEVRSPIIRTNVLLKDQNFRETLVLWEYIEKYSKPGYTTIVQDSAKELKKDVKNGIYDIFSLLQFVIRLNLSDQLIDHLEKNYQEEEKRIAQEKEKLEKERKKEVERKIRQATAEVEQRYNNEIISLQIQINNLSDSFNKERKLSASLSDELDRTKKELIEIKEKQLAEIEKLKADFESEKELNQRNQETIDRYEKLIASAKDECQKALAAKEKEYADQLNAYAKQAASLEKTNAGLNKTHKEDQLKIGQIKKELENRNRENGSQLKAIDRLSAKLSRLNKQSSDSSKRSAELTKKNKELTKQLRELKDQNKQLQSAVNGQKRTIDFLKSLLKRKKIDLNKAMEDEEK